MLIGIDHLVILVADLDAAIESYTKQGFTVVPGGRHPTHTHNALIALADGSYLELLAFYEPYPESKWWSKVAQGGGLIAVCLQTNDLEEEIEAFRAAGIGMSDPKPLSRVRPDGYRLEWLLSLHEGEHPDVVPFLIEDQTPREERVPPETSHANGVTGIGTVTFAVDDVPAVRRWFSGILGKDGEDISRDEPAGAGVDFVIGGHKLEFLAPPGSKGPLHDWLRARGASPFSFDLSTAAGRIVHPVIEPTK